MKTENIILIILFCLTLAMSGCSTYKAVCEGLNDGVNAPFKAVNNWGKDDTEYCYVPRVKKESADQIKREYAKCDLIAATGNQHRTCMSALGWDVQVCNDQNKTVAVQHE